MSERDDFYNSMPYQQRLHAWKEILDHGDIKDAVAYWVEHGSELNVNAYVKRGQQWFPVVYYCCLDPKKAAMTRCLMMKGADIDLLPDADRYEYLPFVCNSLYLITIAKKTKHRPYAMSPVLIRSINNRLNGGDSRRLDHLMRLNLLSEEAVRHVIRTSKDIILDKLQTMVKYLTYMYNVRAPADEGLNVKEETDRAICKFVLTVEFLIVHSAESTAEAANYCVDHYLHEFLHMFKEHKLTEPVYHTQKNSTLTAVLRPLLNDRRYVHTCEACGTVPDEDVFQYNIGC